MKKVSTGTATAIILTLFTICTAFGQEGETAWIDLEAHAVGVLQSSPGFAGQSGDIDGATGATALFDAGLTVRPWESGAAYVRIKAGIGDGIDEDIPNFSIFNAAAIGSDARLEEVWYEHSFGENVRLRGGKIDFSMIFDTNEAANNEYEQFLSNGFVNNPAVEFPEDTGLGAMLWFSPNTFYDIGVGFVDAAGEWDDVFNSLFSIAELGIKPELAGRPGNYRFYLWHNGNDHERLLAPEDGYAANYGFGLSADQEIYEGVTLFTRYGRQRGSVSPVEHAWSAGIDVSGKFFGRRDDTLGLAYGRAITGKDWKSLVADVVGMDPGSEHRLEIYYRFKANDYLNISPNLQWVKNPALDKGNDNAWAFGIRAHLNLFRVW